MIPARIAHYVQESQRRMFAAIVGARLVVVTLLPRPALGCPLEARWLRVVGTGGYVRCLSCLSLSLEFEMREEEINSQSGEEGKSEENENEKQKRTSPCLLYTPRILNSTHFEDLHHTVVHTHIQITQHGKRTARHRPSA